MRFPRDSNYAVIKPPGRNYAGCMIQGDSLVNPCRMAKNIATFTVNSDIDDKDFHDNVQEFTNSLVGRLLHYQDVLTKNGVDFPHVHPFEKDNLVELVSDAE